MAVDIVTAAKDRRAQIRIELAKLEAEDKELEAFLVTANRLSLHYSASTEGTSAERTPLKAGKKDIVSTAIDLIRSRQGGAVLTREVIDQLEMFGFGFGGNTSTPSSLVSAYLSQALEIKRSPDGNGWVLSPAGELLG